MIARTVLSLGFISLGLLRLGLLTLAGLATAGAAELPADIRARGTLRASINAIYPPMEYKDLASGKLVGLDVDLGEAIADKLGVKIVWSDSAFEQLLPSLQTGRADLVISALNDRPERRASFDLIDYLRTGPQFYVLKDSPAQVPIDLCGKTVGTSRSTSLPNQIADWSRTACEAAGKPAVEVVGMSSNLDARAALKQTRINAAAQGSETLPYAMSQDTGIYRPLGAPFATGYQAIAIAKTNPELTAAIADALAALIVDGTYQRVLAKWSLSGHALDTVLLNGEPRR